MDAQQPPPPAARPDLRRFAWLSIAAAILTIGLKSGAYLLTGSVGLLSDAAESVVNLVAAIVALIALGVAAQPFDEKHHFGHSKAEYFSAAIEGIMIFVAAGFILWTSVERFLHPAPLENVGIGLGISVVASAVNGAVAVVLGRAGRAHRSITLVADGKHLMTDVWTSAGVVVGVLLVALTGWLQLDPIIAFLVGLNIIWTGWHLIAQSVDGLMDRALSTEEHARLQLILDDFDPRQVRFHSVQTRVAGHARLISMHVLLPGDWTIQKGHDLIEDVESRLVTEFDHAQVFTHMEPIEDPRSYEDNQPGLAARNGADRLPTTEAGAG
ncbi:Ferrous-iron efflux pump FieF [Propionicimonas sp. T2.31MG-18]|uniref:cation diffusion facilitator family transporter n=1 Tax=Propionicimonas sp. T2.31MG-18 TaxID=3157620 RepID=UPI0035E66B3E